MRSYIVLFLMCSVGCYSIPEQPDSEKPEEEQHYLLLDEEILVPEILEPPSIDEPEYKTYEVLLDLHNKQRKLKKLNALQLDPYLSQYAKNHSDWMANKNRLKHSDIGMLLEKSIGKYSLVGENIAWNYQTEQKVMDAWMKSSGHRANIMKKSFDKVGFGISYNSKGQPYWCACFAMSKK